jgi:flagellar hook assembly protein FlgD
MQYPLLNSVDEVSLERISPDRSSKDVTNWHSAAEAVGFATPAYINSQFGKAVTDQNEITLSPDIFSPDNDGYNDNLAIAYTFGTPGNNATIIIFDATGRLVRNLVNHELCGTTGAFAWDGITNDRLKASIGRYIVSVEIFDLQGKVKRYKKSAILGGKL